MAMDPAVAKLTGHGGNRSTARENPLSPSKRLSFLTATFCSRVGSGAPLRLPLAVRKDVPNGLVCATLNSQSDAGQLS
jgi:hypothetical protein